MIKGEYNTVEIVDAPFNNEDAGDPVISRSENYLVFGSTRQGGFGKGDIYVAFKDGSGTWSDAINSGS